MSESDMRNKLLKVLKPLDAIAVENPILPGTPDVEYIGGWIELKWLRKWPERPDTTVAVDHYTPQQKVWARRRARRGGRVWLLLQCRYEWLLFEGEKATTIVGQTDRETLIQSAHTYWRDGLDREELIRCLTCN